MKLTDSMLLARAKFKAKKVRSILTAMAAGFMLVVLITSSFFITALINEVASKSGSRDKILAVKTNYDSDIVDEMPDGAIDEYEFQRLQTQVETIDSEQVFSTTFDSDFFFAEMYALDDELFVDMVTLEGYEIEEPNTVPLLVSTDYVMAKNDIRFDSSDTVEHRAKTISEAQDALLGKVVDVVLRPTFFMNGDKEEEQIDSQTVKAMIVGYTGSSSSLFASFPGNYVPSSSLQENDILKTYAEVSEADTSYVEASKILSFDSQESRAAFMKECADRGEVTYMTSCTYYRDPLATIQQITGDFKGFLRVIVIILAVIVASSMFVTVSKIIGDSERETGVFRAIGAKRWDVASIYLNYAILLATAAFIIASLLAVLLSLFLTAKYGASFGYQIAETTNNYSEASSLVLIGFNPRELLNIYLIGVGAALLGTVFPILNVLRKDPIKAMRSE